MSAYNNAQLNDVYRDRFDWNTPFSLSFLIRLINHEPLTIQHYYENNHSLNACIHSLG